MSDSIVDAGEPGDESAEAGPDIVVISGMPDADDMAAITAVLAGVLEELAVERGRREASGPNAWAKSQRDLRSPMHAGPGEWRGFSA